MSEETSGSFTSRLFRKASANLAPAVTVQVADSPLSTRNSSSSPLAVERAPSFGNVVQSAVSTSNAITQDYILFSQPVIAAGTMVRRRKDGARMLVHFLAELPIGDEFVTVNDNSLVRSSEEPRRRSRRGKVKSQFQVTTYYQYRTIPLNETQTVSGKLAPFASRKATISRVSGCISARKARTCAAASSSVSPGHIFSWMT